MQEKDDPDQITLGSFLEANQRLITVIGVFSALTLFGSTIQPREFGQFLASLFLTLVLLVWLELWGRFPPQRGGWRLRWFENIMSLLVLVLVLYWVVVIHVWFRGLVTIVVFGGTMATISAIGGRYNLFNRLFNTVPNGRPGLRHAVGIALQLVVFALSLGVAQLIGLPVDNWLDSVSAHWLRLQTP